MCSYNSEISEQKMLITFNACMLGTRGTHISMSWLDLLLLQFPIKLNLFYCRSREKNHIMHIYTYVHICTSKYSSDFLEKQVFLLFHSSFSLSVGLIFYGVELEKRPLG